MIYIKERGTLLFTGWITIAIMMIRIKVNNQLKLLFPVEVVP